MKWMSNDEESPGKEEGDAEVRFNVPAKELLFSVGAREIYDEVKGLRSDVRHALSSHDDLVKEVTLVKSDVAGLKKIVYAVAPVAGLLGYFFNSIISSLT